MSDEAEDLCRQMVGETLERIRAHREKASVPVAELLEVMEQRLLHPDFDVNELLRVAGQRDKNISARFAAEVKLGPKAYIIDLRMELAARMLAASTFQVWRVGVQVGYLWASSFSRTFKEWSGQSPTAYRAAARSEAAAEEALPASREVASREQIEEQMAAVDLPDEQAEILAGRLYALGDLISAGYQLGSPAEGGRVLESARAHGLWHWIEKADYETQREAIESQAPSYRTPALFHRLCTVTLEAENDVLGLQRVNLALACLPTLGERLGKSAVNLFARGWVVAGYAQRRAGQLDDAAQSFGEALRALRLAGDGAHPLVAAELCFYQAILEIDRGDYKGARMLLDRGMEVHRKVVERVFGQDDESAPEGAR